MADICLPFNSRKVRLCVKSRWKIPIHIKTHTCILQQVPLTYHIAALGSACWILVKFGTAQSCASFWNEWIARVEGDWSHFLGQQMASKMHKEAHNVSDCHSDHLFWMGQDTHPTIPWFSPLQPGVWNRQSTLAASVSHVLKSRSVRSITSHRLLVLIIMKQPSASLLHLKRTVPCFIEAWSCERRWC